MFWKKKSQNTKELLNAQQIILQKNPHKLIINVQDIQIAKEVADLLKAINQDYRTFYEDGMCTLGDIKQYSMDSCISKGSVEITIEGDILFLLKEFRYVKLLSEQSSNQLQQQFMSKHTTTFNDSEKAPLINRVSP